MKRAQVKALIDEIHSKSTPPKIDWMMGTSPKFQDDSYECGRNDALFKLAYPARGASLSAAYLPLLDDRYESVRAAAAIALAQMNERSAVKKIRVLFRSLPRTKLDANGEDESSESRERETSNGQLLARALMKLGDCEMVPEIISRESIAPQWNLLFHEGCKEIARPLLAEKLKQTKNLKVPDPSMLHSTIQQTIRHLDDHQYDPID